MFIRTGGSASNGEPTVGRVRNSATSAIGRGIVRSFMMFLGVEGL
jgi:hypothetical protein